MIKDNVIEYKTYSFANRIVKAYRYLTKEQKEFILSKQLLRSGTAIGALVREAKFAQSKADFINKMSIALKEANETKYWLSLLYDNEYIDNPSFQSIFEEAKEVTAILVSIVKTTKENH
ncbi:MAG: four helix bundle protein [Bacteroidaceae bacterium]|jgi:four helix bundle protein|nr:four helix bundle protein [Bacteroidaceae bacterium]